MKNKEKYVKEIAEQAIQGLHFAFDKHSKRIVACGSIRCDDCLFHGFTNCKQKILEWANAEYKEPKQFTEREKKFIRFFPSIQYIARDRNGSLYVYMSKPEKSRCAWLSDNEFLWEIESYMNLDFLAIQWTDEEPTSREEILGKEKDGV